jgi:hypothetical protein
MSLVPRTRRSRVLAGVTLAALVVAALLAGEIVSSGRTRPPVTLRASAVAAFEKASRGPAAAWAGDALRAADTALRAALVDWSRQEGRPFLARDYRPVAAALSRAEALAAEAGRRGAAGQATARSAAEQAVADARALEGHALALVAVTTLPPPQRSRLQGARLLLREAESLLRSGDVVAARQRADASREELRTSLGPALEAAERYTSARQIARWRRWVDETRAWSRSTGQSAVLVLKEKNTLVLLSKGAPARTYDAEVGANALARKRRQGDRATPEGRYRVVARKDSSRYHHALLLDYPNAEDRARFAAARRRGEIPGDAEIGGLIEIHGEGGRGNNWTDGCVALSNDDMDDLYRRVGVGTRVTIVGGDGRDGAFSDLLARVGAVRESTRR